jgi:hypothetical protein
MNLLKSKMAWFLLLIYLFSFVGMTMSLFDFHSGSKGDLAEKMAKYKKEGIPQDDPSFLMMKYEYEHIPDLQAFHDTQDLLSHNDFLIYMLCLIFASTRKVHLAKKLRKREQWIRFAAKYVSTLSFVLILFVVELSFSLIYGKFIGEYITVMSIPVIVSHHIRLVSLVPYVLITRGLSFVRVSVFCALGLLLSSLFKKNWISALVALGVYGLSFAWYPDDPEKFTILERFWFNNYDMGDPFHWLQSWPGTPLWFGLVVQIVSLGVFLAGAWFLLQRRLRSNCV